MNNKFEIGKKYYGVFPVLSYEWKINHNEDDICTAAKENWAKSTYLWDCLYDDATYLGKASDCRCDKCNRLIQNGHKFVDDNGQLYCYGPECVETVF